MSYVTMVKSGVPHKTTELISIEKSNWTIQFIMLCYTIKCDIIASWFIFIKKK